MRREMQKPFIYGTTGYDTSVGRAATKFQNILKKSRPDTSRPEIYDPGPRVHEAIAKGYQMMDMYYGNEGYFYRNRQPNIAKYLHYALQLETLPDASLSGRVGAFLGFRQGLTYDASKSGRANFLNNVADKREGWDKNSERKYLCIHHNPKGRYSSTENIVGGKEEYWTHTKAMSWVVRRMVEFYSGKLIFEGKDCAYQGIFEDPGYGADSNIEARDIFQYLEHGASSGMMGTGAVFFHLDGVEKIPTKDLFLSMWRHGGNKGVGMHSKAVAALPAGTVLRRDLWDKFKSDPLDNPTIAGKIITRGFVYKNDIGLTHKEMLQQSVSNNPRHAFSLTPEEAEDLRNSMMDPEEAARNA